MTNEQAMLILASTNARIAGMQAANQQALHQGYGIVYTEDHFVGMAVEIEELIGSLVRGETKVKGGWPC